MSRPTANRQPLARDVSYTPTEASNQTGCSGALLNELRAAGKGPLFFYTAGEPRYRPKALASWLNHNRGAAR